MEKLNSFIQGKELYVESFLKKRNVRINNLNTISKEWEEYFYRFNIVENDFLKSYLSVNNLHVEGSICIWFYGKEIISFRHWDLIDQLWCYFIDSINLLMIDGIKETSFSFPDQPLDVVIKKDELNIILFFDGREVLNISEDLFCRVLLNSATYFLERLSEVLKNNSYRLYVSKAKEVLKLLS